MKIYELANFTDIVATEDELREIRLMIDKILLGRVSSTQLRMGDRYVKIVLDARIKNKVE